MTPTVTTAAAAPPAAPTAAPRRFTVDSRYVAPILITFILIGANFGFGILEAMQKTAVAIITSILTELVLGKLITKKWPHLASAYISGISCGILVRSPEWWPYILAAMISITSKYAIRVNGRHLWNPSNLGIAALLFLAPQTVASLSIQWGNNVYPMLVIWALGTFIVSRLGRMRIVATYVLAFVGFALLRAVIGAPGAPSTFSARFLSEVAPITGPMYQLFIFFMITDPKTTVTSKRGQMLVAFLVAAMECALRLYGNFYNSTLAVHAPYYALFLTGPSANLIEIGVQAWRKRRGTPATPKPAVAAA